MAQRRSAGTGDPAVHHVFGADPQQHADSSVVFDMLLNKFFSGGRGEAVDEVCVHEGRPLSISIEARRFGRCPRTLPLDPWD
jgi:hypothetical protein